MIRRLRRLETTRQSINTRSYARLIFIWPHLRVQLLRLWIELSTINYEVTLYDNTEFNVYHFIVDMLASVRRTSD